MSLILVLQMNQTLVSKLSNCQTITQNQPTFLLAIVGIVLNYVSNKISNVKAILRDGNEQFLPDIYTI